MLYFAYGSNMNHEQMKNRCPSAVFIQASKLNNYKFVYDGHSSTRSGAVANITEKKGNIVMGGLFEINNADLVSLDGYEGYPNSYDRKIVEVVGNDKKNYKAIAYYRIGKTIGEPSLSYRECILQGAKDCGLPESYIKDNI